MTEPRSTYKHDDSDKKLDQSAEAAKDAGASKTDASGSGHHDPAKIRQHDDDGKDRLFEAREQHDDAEKKSEKNRLAKDVDRHHHDTKDDASDAGATPK